MLLCMIYFLFVAIWFRNFLNFNLLYCRWNLNMIDLILLWHVVMHIRSHCFFSSLLWSLILILLVSRREKLYQLIIFRQPRFSLSKRRILLILITYCIIVLFMRISSKWALAYVINFMVSILSPIFFLSAMDWGRALTLTY